MKKLNRSRLATVASVVSACAVGPAAAIGFGTVSPVATLGQTLDMTVPVRTEGNERFDADCAQVDVAYGDNHLPPNQIRTEVTSTGTNTYRVHITTSAAITEPVVEVSLTAGCERPFTRTFTAFADPPNRVALQPAPATTAPAATAATPHAVPPAGTAAGTELAAASDGSARPAPASAPARRASGASRPSARVATERGTSRPSTAAESVAAAPAAPHPARGHAAAQRPVHVEEQPRLVLDSGYARLKLDIDEPVVMPAPAAGASAPASVYDLADADEAALRRVQALEQSLQALRKDSQAERDRVAALQSRLAAAENRTDWMPWLLAALGLSIGAAGILGWRLREATKARAPSSWFNDVASVLPPDAAEPPRAPPAPVRVPAPPVVSDLAPSDATPPAAEAPAAGGIVGDHEPPTIAPFPHVEDVTATRPLSRTALAAVLGPSEGAAPPRELSVEELLDLEQQADFFIALGQEDAAVDLLMSHLRNAGGQSPLPYTKLLEIYRRQGDRAAYERTRARFNRRFNAYAPDWDVGPGAGRTLEDYPETIARLQAVWPTPIDAMAILEAMLFKRDDTSELFDLPAYRDVLVLYALARDLWQQSGATAGMLVDVLLPLDDFGPADSLLDLPPVPPVAGEHIDRAAPIAAVPAPDPGLPRIDDGVLPSRPASLEPPSYELTGFELLAEHDEGGVQASLDAAHLRPQRAPHGPGASNDESAPHREPGASRGPSTRG
jgi:hypothetical protein